MYLDLDVWPGFNIEIPDDIWIPQGHTINIAGREIAGMIYLGSRENFRTYEWWADSTIDPYLQVEKRLHPLQPPYPHQRLLYCTRYFELGARDRANYLDWLAGDRAGLDCHESVIRLYFYGLERRFFLDSPPLDEQHAIIKEVERLRETYAHLDNFRKIKRILCKFLYTAHAIVQPPEGIKPRFEVAGREIPLDVRVAIAHRIATKQSLSADWVLSWYTTHPDTPPLRTAARRAFPEFRALFGQLFEKTFPNGILVPHLYSVLEASYISKSRAFNVLLTPHEEIPNLPLEFDLHEEVDEIIHEATEALGKFSRVLGKYTEGRKRIEVHAFLPQSLQPLFPNTAIKVLEDWAETVIESEELVPIEQVIENVHEVRPEKITKGHITKTADILALRSIGMVPDPRFDLRGPKIGEPAVLFRLPQPVTEQEESSIEYLEALLCLGIGGFIANADERMNEDEKALLAAYIDSTPAAGRDRLLANLQWILAVPPSLTWFRNHLKRVSKDALHRIGKLALRIAAADGRIETAEIKALEKLYHAMGLPPESIYSELHALSTPGGPKTILSPDRTQDQGFAIPSPDHNKPIILDERQIASLKTETAQVSALLGDIFEEEVTKDATTDSNDSTDTFDGLDARHSAFLRELLTRQHWGRSEYAALAERFQLMQEGALETLNEWAYDRFEDVLIDEDSDYELNLEISNQLRQFCMTN